MNYLGRLLHDAKVFYNDLNPSVLSGAIDVIVIYDKDTDTYNGSPFHIRFGKFGALHSNERNVEVQVNGCTVELNMRLGKRGEAYFKVQSDYCSCEQCLDDDFSMEVLSDCETPNFSNTGNERDALSDDYEVRSKSQSTFIGSKDDTTVQYDYDVWDWGEFPTKLSPDKVFDENVAHQTIEKSPGLCTNCCLDIPSFLEKSKSDSSQSVGYRVSLCGNLKKSSEKPAKFDDLLLTYETLDYNPLIVLDKDIVVEYKNRYYPWFVASPMILSSVLFGKQIEKKTIKQLKYHYHKNQSTGWFKWRKSNKKYDYHDSSDEKNEINFQSFNNSGPISCKRKSLTLPSNKLAQLMLNNGRNDITFKINSRLYGSSSIESRIYLWDSRDKIVISDIDGTITRSDVMGHISYFVGKDWTHSGVTKLLSSIKDNGYRIAYLSSRTIGISHITRKLLSGINKDSTCLPDGPILLSPSSLFRALHVEIIIRKPEIFKIDCLKSVRNLFNAETYPLYAGFGNRQTDAISYKTVGINNSRIFITNTSGEIMQMTNNCKTLSFEVISSLCEHIFPRIEDHDEEASPNTQFNDVEFWNL